MKIQDKITAAKRAEDNAQLMGIVKNDSYLVPFNEAICGRHNHAVERIKELTFEGKQTLSDFANGYNYYGLHKTNGKWIFREWVPNATNLYLIGDFNNWERSREYQCKRIEGTAGDWELILDEDKIHHGDLFKMYVFWNGGEGERIPAWAQRVVQDEGTKIFSAQVWFPEEEYQWKHKTFKPNRAPLLIYECHIGMGQDAEKVGTYIEFRKNVLPRIVDEGYNAIQIMAIQEHPYYGSFGYHVSSFFAPSSRFGTPEELKELIDEAHSNGLAVIMDIVHSHAVKNEIEGLGNLAGDPNQYFYPGERHEHPAWDSLCFDYGKNEVLHFLLSNCKFWLEEYHFDGFRFDGVTSMLYYSHGLGEAFCNYVDYFNGHQDDNAICYLTLANCLIHEVNSHAITIAEEVSGMPGLAAKFKDGGYGFDYRMAMNIPDYWIKTIKELPDEEWIPSSIFWEVKNRRSDERTISYCEGNGWSYKYARRQWNLVDNKELCYHYLGDFDKKMLEVIKSEPHFNDTPLKEIWHNDTDQILAFSRNQLIFVFNFSPTRSFSDYGFLVPNGTYNVVLNTDSWEYGGFGFVDENVKHITLADPLYEKDGKGWLKLYIPARSALVLRKKK